MVCSCANVQCEHIASAGLLQRALVLTMSPPRRPYRSESRSTVKTSEEERWHMRKAIHLMIAAAVAGLAAACGEGTRSVERRVGEEGRSRWSSDHLKKKINSFG